MTDSNIPECAEHTHLPVRLEQITSFYRETNSLIPEDIEYLLGQAQWAIDLDRAGEALNRSSAVYIEELKRKVADLNEKFTD